MAIGDLIQDVDYNNIRNKVTNTLGTGSGSYGYGQDARIQSSSVSDGAIVTAAQWTNLRYDILNIYVHQNGVTPTTLPSVSASQPIRYGAGYPNTAYDTVIDSLRLSPARFTVGSGRFGTDSAGSISRTDSWSSLVQTEITVTFASANVARYFFNSGGAIRFASSRTGGSSTAQNNSWSNLLTAAGTQAFAAASPAGVNFYSLTNSYQTWYSTTATSPYASNVYTLQAKCNVANNSGGTATILTFLVRFSDAYVDPDVIAGSTTPTAPSDVVNGTLTVTCDQIRAQGVMQPSPSAGNFTIAGPTVPYTFGTLTGS